MTATERVLLVEDDESVRGACRRALEAVGFEVVEAVTGEAASELIAAGGFVGAVVDLVLPDAEGLDLLRAMRRRDAEACLILMTGYASLDSAIAALRLGACDYVRKPLDATEVAQSLRRAVEAGAAARQSRRLVAELREANEELARRLEALEGQIQADTRAISILTDLVRETAAGREADQALARVLAQGAQLVRAACGALFRCDEEAKELVCHAVHGLPAADFSALKVPFDQGVLGKAMGDQQPAVENDLVLNPSVPDAQLRALGLGSVLAVPLLAAGSEGGVLAFFDKAEGHFDDHDVGLASVLAFGVAHLMARAPLGEAAAPEAGDRRFVPIQDIAKSQ